VLLEGNDEVINMNLKSALGILYRMGGECKML